MYSGEPHSSGRFISQTDCHEIRDGEVSVKGYGTELLLQLSILKLISTFLELKSDSVTFTHAYKTEVRVGLKPA